MLRLFVGQKNEYKMKFRINIFRYVIYIPKDEVLFHEACTQ